MSGKRSARLQLKAAMRSADIGYLADQIARLERAGIDGLHFDVMDGHFVPEICFGPLFIRGLRKCTRLPFEVHLLVNDPDGCAPAFLDAGADGVLLHIETSRDPAGTLARIRAQGAAAGLAIVPASSAERLAPYLDACDTVNVMTVVPGAPGALSDAGVRNVEAVAAQVRARGRGPLVQADGAVSDATRDRLISAGAGALVAGYPIFSCEDFGEAVAGLRREWAAKEA